MDNQGVPGVGVTPLVGGQAVGPTNPFPVVGPGVSPAAVLWEVVPSTAGGFGAGSTTLVNGVAGKVIRLLGYSFSNNGPVINWNLQSSTATFLTPIWYNSVMQQDQGQPFLSETAAGEDLDFMNFGAPAVAASIYIRYQII